MSDQRGAAPTREGVRTTAAGASLIRERAGSVSDGELSVAYASGSYKLFCPPVANRGAGVRAHRSLEGERDKTAWHTLDLARIGCDNRSRCVPGVSLRAALRKRGPCETIAGFPGGVHA